MVSVLEILFIFCCISATFLVFCYYILTWHLHYWKKRGVPGPKPVFLFGNIKRTVLRQTQLLEDLKKIYDDYPNDKVVGIFYTRTPVALIRDLEVIQHIMIKDFDNFVDRGVSFDEGRLGMNLFHSDGDSWRVLRSKLSPIFTSGKLKNMFPLIDKTGDTFLEYLDSTIKKSSDENINQLMQKFTLASIGECAFGIQIDIFNPNSVYAEIDKNIFSTSYAIEIDFMFPGLLKKLGLDLFPNFINDFFFNMVQKIVKERKGVPSNRKDFMDLLIELKNQGIVHGSKKHENDKDRSLEINDQVMAAQAFVFYAAGYETSASTVSFLLYEIAHYQDVQENLLKEIDEILQKNEDALTYESLKDFKYMEQVLNETLRVHPIIDPLFRIAERDYKIPGTNIVLEKGIKCIVSVSGVHHDETIYPDPMKFNPDRFLPENAKERHPCANLSFGIGPRNCIGMRFANIQSKVALVKILSKYRVEPSSLSPKKITIDPERLIKSAKGGLHVKLIKRH